MVFHILKIARVCPRCVFQDLSCTPSKSVLGVRIGGRFRVRNTMLVITIASFSQGNLLKAKTYINRPSTLNFKRKVKRKSQAYNVVLKSGISVRMLSVDVMLVKQCGCSR